MLTSILEVTDLRVTFPAEAGPVTAVDGIRFALERGETLGIVGESGSGKSVTALALMGLLPGARVEGEVFFRESGQGPVDLNRLPEEARRSYRGRKIAMIFQEPMTSLNPVIRCGEQIAETIRRHRPVNAAAARRATLELIGRVKLPDAERIYRAYPHELSGGQKQRVMIAMALSCNPDILIADEPTTALDVTVQRSILELIQELKSVWKGSVIFITHDLGLVGEIADRVLVMHRGRVVEEGAVKEVFRSPAHPYTRGLLACRPPLEYRLRRLPVAADFENGENPPTVRVTEEEERARLEQVQSRPPLLAVRDLETWFPTGRTFWGRPRDYVRAVDGVSFDLYPGETLGLVGESGCGKTTLGRSLLNLARPRGGSIVYSNTELTRLEERDWKPWRKEMQIIFQDPYGSLNPRRPAGEAILEPLRVHDLYENDRRRRERVDELLELVRLEPRQYYSFPHEFSGGQRQRLCIARALAVEPRLLICDESVSALDVSVQAQILNLLMDLRDRFDLSLIFISHDLAVVRYISDRLLVMYQGKIVESGPALEVYRNPQSEYTRRLVRSSVFARRSLGEVGPQSSAPGPTEA